MPTPARPPPALPACAQAVPGCSPVAWWRLWLHQPLWLHLGVHNAGQLGVGCGLRRCCLTSCLASSIRCGSGLLSRGGHLAWPRGRFVVVVVLYSIPPAVRLAVADNCAPFRVCCCLRRACSPQRRLVMPRLPARCGASAFVRVFVSSVVEAVRQAGESERGEGSGVWGACVCVQGGGASIHGRRRARHLVMPAWAVCLRLLGCEVGGCRADPHHRSGAGLGACGMTFNGGGCTVHPAGTQMGACARAWAGFGVRLHVPVPCAQVGGAVAQGVWLGSCSVSAPSPHDS
jgi:hypothetical protein